MMTILTSSGSPLRSTNSVPGTIPDFSASSLVTTHGGFPIYGIHPWMQDGIIYADGKSFVFWLDQQGTTWTERGRHYDHLTETWGSEINIASAHAEDGHNYPSTVIDSDGYFHIFYGAHTTPIYYKKSTNPYDISAWGSEVELPKGTYPRPIIDSSGNIYLFFRGSSGAANSGRYLSYVKSTDGGATWGAQVNIADIGDDLGYVYSGQIAIGSDDTIYVAWSWLDDKTASDADGSHDICFAKSDDGGVTWKKSDGTSYSLPVLQATAEKVRAGYNVMSPAIFVVGSIPIIFYNEVQVGNTWSYGLNIKSVYFDGSWQDGGYLGGSGYEHGFGTVLIQNGNVLYVFAPKSISGVYEMGYYKSLDAGVTWGSFIQITSGNGATQGIIVKPYTTGGIEIAWTNDDGNVYHAFGQLDTVITSRLLTTGDD